MTTVRDLCAGALKKLGVLGADETMSSGDAAHVFSALNDWIDENKTENLTIFEMTRSTWTIVSGTGTYTVGAGGDVSIARPLYKNIEHVSFQDTGTNLEVQLQPFTVDAWAKVALKTLTNSWPQAWFYNPAFPLGTLELWPVPTSATLQGVIYALTAVEEFASLDTVISLPPGYRNFISHNLALEVAPDFERKPSALLVRQAQRSTANIKRANIRLADLSSDAGALVQGSSMGRYNIYAGP